MRTKIIFYIIIFALVINFSTIKAQWVQTYPNLGENYNSSATGFEVIGTNLYAGTTGHGILISSNDGASWTECNSGLTDKYVFSLKKIGSDFFACSHNGIFLSTDFGENWTFPQNANLPRNVNFSDLDNIGTDLFVSTTIQFSISVETMHASPA